MTLETTAEYLVYETGKDTNKPLDKWQCHKFKDHKSAKAKFEAIDHGNKRFYFKETFVRMTRLD